MRMNVAIVSSAVLLSFGALLVHHLLEMRDPADTFEVTEIHSDTASRQFAVTYRYHHANSSSEVWAIWVLQNSPQLGSTIPPAGTAEPKIVWTNKNDVVGVRWLDGRLVVTMTRGGVRHIGSLSECYFEYEKRPQACTASQNVQLLDAGT